jgi:hypothetical protein
MLPSPLWKSIVARKGNWDAKRIDTLELSFFSTIGLQIDKSGKYSV